MTSEQLRRLREIAATITWRRDASVRLSDLEALLKAYDELAAKK